MSVKNQSFLSRFKIGGKSNIEVVDVDELENT